jgi:hypothetical protein
MLMLDSKGASHANGSSASTAAPSVQQPAEESGPDKVDDLPF